MIEPVMIVMMTMPIFRGSAIFNLFAALHCATNERMAIRIQLRRARGVATLRAGARGVSRTGAEHDACYNQRQAGNECTNVLHVFLQNLMFQKRRWKFFPSREIAYFWLLAKNKS